MSRKSVHSYNQVAAPKRPSYGVALFFGLVAFFGGTISWRASSVLVQTFTYIVTDLTEFESEPVDMEMETDEEAVMYGALMAREMVKQMPDITGRGLCVTVYDDEGEPISIVPIDRVN